jgi:hypothetical protein
MPAGTSTPGPAPRGARSNRTFDYAHWTKRRSPLNEQSFDFDPYRTSIMGNLVTPADTEDPAQQLRPGQEQIALTRQYAGRDPNRQRSNVISFDPH